MHKRKKYNKLMPALAVIVAAALFGGVAWLWAKAVPLEAVMVRTIPLVARNALQTQPQTGAATMPARFNLAVPFTPQAPEKKWEQPWQDACEEAAVLMLDAYYKDYKLSPALARDEIIKMVAWEDKRKWELSISADQLKQMLEQYFGLSRVQKVVNPTVEQIKSFVAAGKPILVVAAGKLLRNPHYKNGGPTYHTLIIRGYTEDSFITNDPGTRFGENFLYKYAVLMNAIHDWNGGDVKAGRKVVLVVE